MAHANRRQAKRPIEQLVREAKPPEEEVGASAPLQSAAEWHHARYLEHEKTPWAQDAHQLADVACDRARGHVLKDDAAVHEVEARVGEESQVLVGIDGKPTPGESPIEAPSHLDHARRDINALARVEMRRHG